jgi:hypothetical protein
MTTTPDDLDALTELAASVLDDYQPAADLRPVVEAVLAEAAAQRWIQQQLDQTGIRAMDFRNGVEMELETARELLAHWVAAARTMLGDAPNYTETRLEFDVKVAESPEIYTLVVQRHAPGALTPHEARQKAEKRVAAVFAECEAIEAEVYGQHDEDDDGMREAIRRIRNAAGC